MPRSYRGAAPVAALLFGWLAGVAPAPAADPPPSSAATCVACHGADGNSAMPEIPSLAGQPKQFITTQLVMFREGNRKNEQMSPFALSLTNAEINDLGAFFAAQPLKPAAAAQSGAKADAGRALVEKFNCVQCHGPALKGVQHIPRIAGQHAPYLRVQLAGFKAQTRFDMDGNMTSAAQALAPADIEALSAYLSGLQ